MNDNKIEIGNLYEMNKTVMAKESPLTPKEVSEKKDELIKYFLSGNAWYYMLLCNEQKDYTVLHCSDLNNQSVASAASQEVLECLSYRGQIIAIDHVNEAFECWIKRSGIIYMYALFPYDAAVIEI